MMDDDIFRHFDSMMRTFNRMDSFFDFGTPFPGPGGFGSFGGAHPDPFNSGFSMLEPYPRNRSLRDDFLEPGAQPRGQMVPFNNDHRMVHNFDPHANFFGDGLGSDQSPQPFKSFFQVKQFSSVMNGDKIETKRIETDSSGKRIESHTRTLGDKSYTVTSKRDPTGEQEIEEDLLNMEEKDLSEFDKMWKTGFSSDSWFGPSQGQLPRSPSTPEIRAIEDTPVAENKQKSWKEKLRSWLPF
ncbi:uncharacterized protein LOC107359703 [Tetranychus urticae]|uniref:Myeloid leukemia factor n=1 Tax=Tetranychus urticae TaxID=32264 RepID=T1JR42_TETUR|nr:uncharacterized protein LOC107359703 [Tetranychus urticae]